MFFSSEFHFLKRFLDFNDTVLKVEKIFSKKLFEIQFLSSCIKNLKNVIYNGKKEFHFCLMTFF